MVADNLPYTTVIWNIFFHFYLDKDSHSVLVEQCKKLVEVSGSLRHWNASIYGPLIKMCTEYTLEEVRRHWSLYIDMPHLPPERAKALRDLFTKQSKISSQKYKNIISPARSAGPLILQAIQVSSEQFKNYWSTGTTFTNPKQIEAARLLNPTFVYSLGGEGCSVYHATDPLVPFHLAALFGNRRGPVSIADAVRAAKAQFNDWCSAFHTSISSTPAGSVIIRLILGEATVVCRALQAFAAAGTLNLGVSVAQWKTKLVQLSKDEYISGNAPVAFNVIDTSNMDDHIGLLNVLIATTPLLSMSAQPSVLYSESLLVRGQDATKEFVERLYADITVFGLLVGLCPVDYLSGFTSRSNTHELLMHQFVKREALQFHQVTTWKSPTSGDPVAMAAARNGAEYGKPVFDADQLGTFLYDMYHLLFEQEDSMHFSKVNEEKGNLVKAVLGSNLIHYTRESFVLFLKLVRDKLNISEIQWRGVMERFFDFHDADGSMPMDLNNYNDFCAHLHLHGVHTVPAYHDVIPKIHIFSGWDTVPPLVRIILTVPREKLAVLENSAEQVGSPLLNCYIRGSWMHNIFSSVHVAFGSVVSMDNKTTPPSVLFREDPEGWKGDSSLVVSFVMPTPLLLAYEPLENLNVCFGVRSTPATALLIPKLGLTLDLFSARLLDESCVHLLPQQPLASGKLQISSPFPVHPISSLPAQIGESSAAAVELDQECEMVASLTIRVSVENQEVKILFSGGAIPQIKQVSPCMMRLSIGSHMQDLIYPFPVIGSRNKLRLARKSSYIEVGTCSTTVIAVT
jgi:hypothetical protein